MKTKNSTVSLTKNSQKQLSTSTTEEPYNSKAMKNETLFGGDMVGVEVAKNDPIVDNGKSGKVNNCKRLEVFVEENPFNGFII